MSTAIPPYGRMFITGLWIEALLYGTPGGCSRPKELLLTRSMRRSEVSGHASVEYRPLI
jgi:hypothetical protein